MVKYIMIFAAMLMMVACGDDTNKTPVDNMPAQDDTTTDIDNATDNVVVEEDVIVVDDTETSDEVVDDANDVTVEDSDNLLTDEDEVIVTDDGETPDADVDSAPVPCTTENEIRYLACGLNGNGEQKQKCTGGYWANDGACDDPDECIAGTFEEAPCGLNDRGARERYCVETESVWAWGEWICDDPDECVDETVGHPDEGAACGLNGRGFFTYDCVVGQWVKRSPSECVDPDECVDGYYYSYPNCVGQATEEYPNGFFGDIEACCFGIMTCLKISMECPS